MEATVTIEQFGKLLRSEQEDSALLRVLRQLQSVGKREDVRVPAFGPTATSWTGWA